jgi:hypothetical protein
MSRQRLKKKASKNNPPDFESVLTQKLCKYISGDVKEKTATFCPNHRAEGKPYCADHAAICLVKPPKFNETLFFKIKS